jgi:hypothetical protein
MFAYDPSMQLWILRPQFEALERVAHPWTLPSDKAMGVLVQGRKWTTCEVLTADGEAGVILVVRHGSDRGASRVHALFCTPPACQGPFSSAQQA